MAEKAKGQPKLTEGQRAYEAKRAAKAGVSLEKWLSMKAQEREQATAAAAKASEPKKPGFFARLLERAQRPIG
ncbi:hypothetical protein [Roseomonas sp. KE0001]|uniref:hypothetical protein n=1 Tax=unclassified Roseomonas TaxID=2617492 RepID=UPI0018DF61EF|nr:hypothetical protein [Roseomonas sp. KE0001]MBI0435213.1 hypothetical protein [Roseomonas sp. KE0001]